MKRQKMNTLQEIKIPSINILMQIPRFRFPYITQPSNISNEKNTEKFVLTLHYVFIGLLHRRLLMKRNPHSISLLKLFHPRNRHLNFKCFFHEIRNKFETENFASLEVNPAKIGKDISHIDGLYINTMINDRTFFILGKT